MFVVNSIFPKAERAPVTIRLFVNGLLALALLTYAAVGITDVERQARTPIVVMLSLDGFRYDYLEQYPQQTKNLRRMANSGLQVAGLIPGFPSSTFPSHYSIVTGLHPGKHGIIGNSFFDRSRDAIYRLGNRDAVEDGSWYGGEPLWVAAEKAGLRSASFFLGGQRGRYSRHQAELLQNLRRRRAERRPRQSSARLAGLAVG